MRTRAVLAIVGLLGAFALAACSSGTSARNLTDQVFAVADRKAGPQVSGELLDGSGSFNLADHRGEVVVVNFWASWCSPCRVEADDLEQTYQATKASKVTFVGVNVRDDRDRAIAFTHGRVSYPSLFDPAGRLALRFAVPPTAIPTTIVLDRQGRIAAVFRHAVVRTELEPVVAQIAAEQEPSRG